MKRTGKTEVFAGVHPDAVQIKKSPQEGKGAYLRGVSEMHKMTMSLEVRTTASRFYRTGGSWFPYIPKT